MRIRCASMRINRINSKKNHLFLTKILWFWTLNFHSWGWIKPGGMNNNDILGTQNWKQSQADPFLAQKVAIFGKYSYVDNVDEIFNPHTHPHIPHMRIIRIIRIFRIRMASPSSNTFCRAQKVSGRKWRRNLGLGKNERVGSILVSLVYIFSAFLGLGGGVRPN